MQRILKGCMNRAKRLETRSTIVRRGVGLWVKDAPQLLLGRAQRGGSESKAGRKKCVDGKPSHLRSIDALKAAAEVEILIKASYPDSGLIERLSIDREPASELQLQVEVATHSRRKCYF